MADEKVFVVKDGNSSSGGSGWAIAIVLLVALVIGAYFMLNMSDSTVAKNNAITNAANNVGAAAQEVGDAAKEAVN